MSDLGPTALSVPQSRQKAAVEGRSDKGKVTGKLKKAIDYLVFTGDKHDFAGAAAHADMTAWSIRSALERPHVKAYFRQQMEVLLTAAEARATHRLIEISEINSGMPAVQAIKELRTRPEHQVASSNNHQSPGFVIMIAPSYAPQQIDVTPLQTNTNNK